MTPNPFIDPALGTPLPPTKPAYRSPWVARLATMWWLACVVALVWALWMAMTGGAT